MELRQDAKMREMLDKIHKEHYEVEKWQQNFKKQQARENVAESLRLRQQIDEELAENLLKKEGQLNKLYSATQSKGFNIHENSVKKVGQRNLTDMFRTPDK